MLLRRNSCSVTNSLVLSPHFEGKYIFSDDTLNVNVLFVKPIATICYFLATELMRCRNIFAVDFTFSSLYGLDGKTFCVHEKTFRGDFLFSSDRNYALQKCFCDERNCSVAKNKNKKIGFPHSAFGDEY